jgi:acyl carrier protein
VELGEIEAALLQHPGVKEVAVLMWGVEEDKKRIVAYVVAHEKDGLSRVDLREYLKTKLPEYMVPGGWIMLEDLPLTTNGKLDREALAGHEEESDTEAEEYVAPRTELEQKVAEVWNEVLRMEQVSIHANFFDLGGHSLIAAQLVSRLQQAFSVSIPLRLVFDSPTIAELAEGIEVLLWMAEQEQLPQP